MTFIVIDWSLSRIYDGPWSFTENVGKTISMKRRHTVIGKKKLAGMGGHMGALEVF